MGGLDFGSHESVKPNCTYCFLPVPERGFSQRYASQIFPTALLQANLENWWAAALDHVSRGLTLFAQKLRYHHWRCPKLRQ